MILPSIITVLNLHLVSEILSQQSPETLQNESPDGVSSEISKTRKLDNLNSYEVTIVDYIFDSSLSSMVGKHPLLT